MVVLAGPIEADLAQDIIAQLLYLDDRNAAQPIQLFVNSPGGGVPEGLAIVDTIDHISSPVHTYCYGRADAMAAVIIAHGEKGKRHASPNARFSLSDPFAKETSTLPRDEMSEELARCRTAISQTLGNDTGKPAEDILRAMAKYTRFDTVEAQMYNLIDEVSVRNPFEVIAE
jgi:ATP-dependent Clp protease protease subunit